MKKFLFLIFISLSIVAEPNFYQLVKEQSKSSNNFVTESKSNLQPFATLINNDSSKKLNPSLWEKTTSKIKSWFKPQTKTDVNKTIEKVEDNKPGFFKRVANKVSNFFGLD